MHLKSVAFAGAVALILTAMPSAARDDGKAARLAAAEQSVLVAGTAGPDASVAGAASAQPSADDAKAEAPVRRTESGIRIVGAPFLPEN